MNKELRIAHLKLNNEYRIKNNAVSKLSDFLLSLLGLDSIPNTLGNLTLLSYINLDNNKLTGII